MVRARVGVKEADESGTLIGSRKCNTLFTCSTHKLVVMIWFFKFCKKKKDQISENCMDVMEVSEKEACHCRSLFPSEFRKIMQAAIRSAACLPSISYLLRREWRNLFHSEIRDSRPLKAMRIEHAGQNGRNHVCITLHNYITITLHKHNTPVFSYFVFCVYHEHERAWGLNKVNLIAYRFSTPYSMI